MDSMTSGPERAGGWLSRVAVLGESLVDLTRVVADDGSAHVVPMPGGSPYNVAVGLARMGVETWFCGRMSSDPYGALLLDHLALNGVSTDLITVSGEPTASAFVTDQDGEPVYKFRWDGTADRLLQPGDLDVGRLAQMDAVHFGSVSLALGPGSEVIMAVVRQLHGRVTLSFDPNVRIEMASDRDAYRTRVLQAFALARVAKASQRDLQALDVSPTDIVSMRVAAGIDAPLFLTHGAAGQEVWYPDGNVVSTPPVFDAPTVDTVGAGDAFMAGILAALAGTGGLALEGSSTAVAWDDIVRFASTAAAITCGRRGADPPSTDEILAHLSLWPDGNASGATAAARTKVAGPLR